jgi:hypothetical protein
LKAKRIGTRYFGSACDPSDRNPATELADLRLLSPVWLRPNAQHRVGNRRSSSIAPEEAHNNAQDGPFRLLRPSATAGDAPLRLSPRSWLGHRARPGIAEDRSSRQGAVLAHLARSGTYAWSTSIHELNRERQLCGGGSTPDLLCSQDSTMGSRRTIAHRISRPLDPHLHAPPFRGGCVAVGWSMLRPRARGQAVYPERVTKQLVVSVCGAFALCLAACSSPGNAVSTSSSRSSAIKTTPKIVVLDPSTGQVIWSGTSQSSRSRIVVLDPSTGQVIWSGR